MRFAYFPGCTSKGSTPEVDLATQWLANKLQIEIVELEEAGCCGSCEVKAVNPTLHLLLNARILALAEAKGLEILTVCDTCQANLLQTGRVLDKDQNKAVDVWQKLKRSGLNYMNRPRVRHLVSILADEFGADKLKQHVSRPLTGLRVAPFNCCHVFRGPGSEVQDRSLVHDIVAISGAMSTSLRLEGDCCGFHILMVNPNLAAKTAGKFLTRCAQAAVDCIVTTSPLCHTAFDIYQELAERVTGNKLNIPVLHIEQLLALSFGASHTDIGLQRHVVSAGELIKKLAA